MSDNSVSPQELSAQIARILADQEESLVELRHDLHRIPEVGLHLPQTLERVRGEFQELGLEIHDASDVSGFVAILRGGADAATRPGDDRRPLVLLRADMDALPVTEETGLEWASANGAMHGCGHDLHMAGIVGAARALNAVRDQLAGDVLFFLQPGEEGADGAQHLIDDGLLTAAGRLPDHAYGIHVWSAPYPAGRITSMAGSMMASSDVLEVTVLGRGGHGSAPHAALDPVPIAAEMVTQTHVVVTREFDVFHPVVVTCGSIVAGEAANVIPDSATAKFTLRAFDPATRERLIGTLTRLFQGIAAAHGAQCRVEEIRLYPVTETSAEETDYAAGVVDEVFPGRWAEMEHPVSAAEDFSKILQRIPGTYLFIAAVPEGVDETTAAQNHSPLAVFDDSAIQDAARVLTELAVHRLNA